MKHFNYIIMLLFALAFTACSKKTTDAAMDKTAETMDKADQMNDKVMSFRSKAPEPGPARAIQIGEYSSFDLANGLKVIVVENHKLPRVSYQISLKNDPILETDQVGFVSMAGSLMATGTKSKSKAELDAAMDYIGASFNTSGSGMFGSSLKKHQETLLDLMTDVLYNPTFPQEEFEKMKTQSLSGLATVKSDANSIASNVAGVLNYGKDHPYGEVETEATVNNISLDNCKKYYNDYFKANNAYLVVVGDITPEEAKMNAEKYFGSWKQGEVPASDYKAAMAPEGARVAFANKEGAVQSVIRVTHPIDLMVGSEDVIPAQLTNAILGGGVFLGRLMQNLREDKAFTYGARSSINANKLKGSFNAFASVRNEVTDSSVVEFLYEMNRIRTEPVDAGDLEIAKNSSAGSFARSLESPQTIARFALNTFRFNLPKDYYNTYLNKLEAVSVADIQRVANKYIRPENTYIVVAGNKDEVAEKLKPFDSDGTIEYFDAFGNQVEDAGSVLPEGVTGASVVDAYLNAIGGADVLKNVKSLESNYSMSIMGQTATTTMKQMLPNKFSMKIDMQGMTVQEQIYDGTKAKMIQMGQAPAVVTEGPELAQMEKQSKIFPRLDYGNGKYMLDLKGLDDVDGAKVYKLIVTDPDGKKSTEYYDLKSGLLVRTITTEEAQGQKMTQTSNLKNYKAVDGVMIPHTIVIEGMMPQPLEMNASTIKVNPSYTAKDFEVTE